MKNPLDALFGSRTRTAILGELVLHPERELHLRDLVRATGFSPRAVNQEVDRLVGLALLLERRSGNRRYLRANNDHPLYAPLRTMLVRSVGAVPTLQAALDGKPRIRRAILFGSAVTGEQRPDSDIDLLIVGSIPLSDLLDLLSPVEAALSREINPVCMSEEEFQRRFDEREHFVTAVLAGPHLHVAGTTDGTARLGSPRLAQTAPGGATGNRESVQDRGPRTSRRIRS